MRDEVASAWQSSSRDAFHLVAVAPWSTARFRVVTKCHLRRDRADHVGPSSPVHDHSHVHGHGPSRNLASIHRGQDTCDADPT